jgi:hypothetical protein
LQTHAALLRPLVAQRDHDQPILARTAAVDVGGSGVVVPFTEIVQHAVFAAASRRTTTVRSQRRIDRGLTARA